MKKMLKQILLIIVSLLFCNLIFAANAEAEIYGRLAVQGVFNQNRLAVQKVFYTNGVVDGFSVQDGFSYFGLKGRNRIYKSSYLIWQIENFLNLSTGEPYARTTGADFIATRPAPGKKANAIGHPTSSVNTFASSDTFIGINANWGMIRFGNLSNTFRTNTGAIDIFSGNGSAGYQNYDNVMNVLPGTVKYNSPTWGGFNFSTFYNPNNIGGSFNNTLKDNTTFLNEGATNGYYGYGLYGGALDYGISNLLLTYNFQVINNVGKYVRDGLGITANNDFQIKPFNGWAQRLEAGWQDPTGMILGVGAQITNGYNYSGWAGNFGASTIATSPQFAKYKTANQIQTAETGLSLGWHIKKWTPKISYISGTNIMASQSNTFLNSMTGHNQIPGTWYQQVVTELDWSITPKTITFVGAGQIWWGENAIDSGWQTNQGTVTLGFSHVF